MDRAAQRADQCRQMLSAFASVGAGRFDVTITDLSGRKCSFHSGQPVEALRRWLPHRIEVAISCQNNVIVRPRGFTADLVQLDDLSRTMLGRVSGAAFMILATSPGNHQAWVAVRESVPDLARRLRQSVAADPNASGAVRVAGSVNFKPCYAPEYPAVSIQSLLPQRIVSPIELQSLGLLRVTDGAMNPPARASRLRQSGAWPSYERCLQNAPLARGGDRPDVSRADFTFCLLAIDCGRSVEETYDQLLVKSLKAQQQGAAYARLTVERAAAVVWRRVNP